VTDTGGQGPARAGGRGTVAVAGTDPAPGPGGPPPVPVVVVAGRPNVGKSTLVNRIVGRRAAVVEERPGVTRDRLELEAQWAGRVFTVVDTGGWTAAGDALDAKVSAQAERAVAGADLVLLVVDVTVGVTEDDLAMVRWLRRRARAVRVVANKVDNERRELDAWELVQLGLGDPIAVSAMHGRGVGDLLDLVVAAVAAPPAEALAGASVVDGAGGPGRTLQAAGDERLAGAAGGDADVDHRKLAGVGLAGGDPQPRLGGVKGDGHVGPHGRLGDLPRGGIHPAWHVAGDHQRAGRTPAADRLDRARSWLPRHAGKPGAQHRVDDRRRARQSLLAEGLRRIAGQEVEVGKRVA
jgi:small GTP-binding protein